MKKITAVLMTVLCLISLFAFSAGAAQKDTVTCSVLNDTSDFIFDGGSGEITVTPASLYVDGQKKDVYITAVMGMCFDMKKANNIPACVLSAFNLKSKYYKIVKAAVTDNVPEGSTLLVLGHSLGGMIAQQLICDKDITAAYDIYGAVTIGSPYIMTKASRREGTLTRFADVSDNVPKLSPALLFNRKNHKNAAFEDGGYDGDNDKAHNRSYRDAEVWKKYDALGRLNGTSYFTYSPDDVIGIHT